MAFAQVDVIESLWGWAVIQQIRSIGVSKLGGDLYHFNPALQESKPIGTEPTRLYPVHKMRRVFRSILFGHLVSEMNIPVSVRLLSIC